ncbi:MAG: nucleotidyltransferase domain-containing protein, partial [Candidatus Kapabacteria bacterium]|nr:nucleotidyltransferase domain-containing protein [Candidatus Kapabacteria bacterium]
MYDIITASLKKLEEEKEIKILYACESGSRGWGFASEDSDYDVRFMYIHKPEYYLSVNSHPDVIDFFSDDRVFDLSGWDIRKALSHFHGSNPTLFDWLQSPIIYDEKNNFRQELLDLSPSHYSLRKGTHHYLGIMMNTFNEEMNKEQVRLKKIFYVLRTALSAWWIVQKREV